MRIEKKKERERGNERRREWKKRSSSSSSLKHTLTHTSIPLWKVPLMEGNEESKLPTLVLLYFILKKNLHS